MTSVYNKSLLKEMYDDFPKKIMNKILMYIHAYLHTYIHTYFLVLENVTYLFEK